jgi:PilZ domain
VDERRRGPRYPFYASAQITELKSQIGMTARTSELSPHGCYMDMLNPLPLGTAVRIQITYQGLTIDAAGRVIYSQPNMGMGVSFDELQGDQEVLLNKWVEGARGN